MKLKLDDLLYLDKIPCYSGAKQKRCITERLIRLMTNCMRCGGETKPTRKRWRYNNFDVESFYCEVCKKHTFTYSKEGKIQYTIPKKRQ